ncbi:MAG TPA: NAD(P)H-hydrate dehydratase [Candidatus Nanopelagicales bacterium]|nr:NAD(P)H-hydrate dehydratase [Candidatus Nanopelagicales bacterium]
MSAGGVSRTPASVAVHVDVVRRLEATAMAQLPEGTLMQRAAAAIAVSAGSMLRATSGRVTGSRVVLLVGSGDNGGDALYAGARLAKRGARVDALLVADKHHVDGAAALRRAGGRCHVVQLPPAQVPGEPRLRLVEADDEEPRDGAGVDEVADLLAAAELVAAADLVVDGILGIGGRGALREPSATLALVARETDALVLAVDLPSGVDADIGEALDPSRAIDADRTVVLGVLKPGLLVGDGAVLSGDLEVVDIGLDLADVADDEALVLVGDALAREVLERPGPRDDKYSRGVVGLSTGSATYPGAGVLSTGGARHGLAGYVRFSGPAYREVVQAWPDVVADPGPVGDAGRVQAWVVGSGRGTDQDGKQAVLDAVAVHVPVVLDADALSLLAIDAEIQEEVEARSAPTLVTPHDGEFDRLARAAIGPERVRAARGLARELRCVVLLKGSSTIVAPPSGPSYVALAAPAELATAGSGDVLAGLLGSLIAHHEARAQAAGRRLDENDVARIAAVAAHVHGRAGVEAAGEGRTVTALDVAHALPTAIARIRTGPGS